MKFWNEFVVYFLGPIALAMVVGWALVGIVCLISIL